MGGIQTTMAIPIYSTTVPCDRLRVKAGSCARQVMHIPKLTSLKQHCPMMASLSGPTHHDSFHVHVHLYIRKNPSNTYIPSKMVIYMYIHVVIGNAVTYMYMFTLTSGAFVAYPGIFTGGFSSVTGEPTNASLSCSHADGVAVFCMEENITVCATGDVRLAGSRDTSEGRVEVCVNNQWGTVCDDSWNERGVNLVCRAIFNMPCE